MTALEQFLRAGLHRYDPLALREIRDPYGPDATVFGPEQPERAAHDVPVMRTCTAHDVRWGPAGPCWCCEAGIRPVAG